MGKMNPQQFNDLIQMTSRWPKVVKGIFHPVLLCLLLGGHLILRGIAKSLDVPFAAGGR